MSKNITNKTKYIINKFCEENNLDENKMIKIFFSRIKKDMRKEMNWRNMRNKEIFSKMIKFAEVSGDENIIGNLICGMRKYDINEIRNIFKDTSIPES